MTALTDFVLAAVCIYGGLRTLDVYWQKYYLFHFHLGWAFCFLGVAALGGGIFHGFGFYFSSAIADIVWKCILFSAGLGVLFFLLASLSAVASYETYALLRWISLVVAIPYSLLIWRKADFGLAAGFFIPIMVFMLIVMIYIYVNTGDRGAANIVIGLSISFLGALLWKIGLSPHRYFNHNDFYHVVQTIGVWYVYRGGLVIQHILNR